MFDKAMNLVGSELSTLGLLLILFRPQRRCSPCMKALIIAVTVPPLSVDTCTTSHEEHGAKHDTVGKILASRKNKTP
jgi:hypothetical protein